MLGDNMQGAPPDGASNFDFGGCTIWAIENGTFALGMFLMFSKTVDLMTAFAPSSMFGFSGMEIAYGLMVGLLVEGAMFLMKLTLPRAKNPLDWVWTIAVVFLPFIISAIAQIFDGFQVRNDLAKQPIWIQNVVPYFVPSIPTIIVFLLLGKAVFSSLPEGIVKMPKGLQPRKSKGVFEGFVAGFGKKSRPANVTAPKASPVLPAPASSGEHAPARCSVCNQELPFLQYGQKTGADGRVARWPIYQKCYNPDCSAGRKNLAKAPIAVDWAKDEARDEKDA